MKPVTLPILFKSETIETAEVTGQDYSFEDAVIRPVTFYNIAAVGAFHDQSSKQGWFARIYANGTEFISPLFSWEVEDIISGAPTDWTTRRLGRFLEKAETKGTKADRP